MGDAWPNPWELARARHEDTSASVEQPHRRPVWRIEDLPSIWDLEPRAPEWIVEGLVPGGAITLLSGDSGVGKSTLALALAGAVAHGEPFIGRATRQSDVLYIDRENPDYIVQERLRTLGIRETGRLRVWGLWCEPVPQGPQFRDILRFARECKPLVIWDSLIAFHRGSEQDASETRRYFQAYRSLAAAGAGILITHHTGKASTAQEYRGSSDIKAAVDVAYLLEALDGHGGGIRSLRMRAFKNRLALPETLRIEYGDGVFSAASQERAESNREILERLIAQKPGVGQGDIEKLAVAAGVAQRLVRELLAVGVDEGWLSMESGARGRRSYRLAECPEVGVI